MIRTKTYNYVYKTINVINNKIYIGIHSTNDLDDGYIGSGVILKQAIKKYGKCKFSKAITHMCNTRQDALNIERQLVTEAFIQNRSNYNYTTGGGGGLLNHVTVKDNTGNIHYISKDDPNYINGTLLPINNGKVSVKDTHGSYLQIDKSDTRLGEELVGVNSGKTFNHEIRICPYCKFKGSGPSMSKYHFDNCKHNPSNQIVSCTWCGKSGYYNHIAQHHFDNCKHAPNQINPRRNVHKLRECPYCGKVGKGGNMTRYHFDNCKRKIN